MTKQDFLYAEEWLHQRIQNIGRTERKKVKRMVKGKLWTEYAKLLLETL